MRKYLKLKDAEISEEKSSKGIEDDLHKIIGVCDVCFKDGDPVEIDAILNSIVSIMVTVSVLICGATRTHSKILGFPFTDPIRTWRKYCSCFLRKADKGTGNSIGQGVPPIVRTNFVNVLQCTQIS